MGRPSRRHKWWGYVKNCIRDYPRMMREHESIKGKREALDGLLNAADELNRPTEREALNHAAVGFQGQEKIEFDGVGKAIQETKNLPDGAERLTLLNLVFWNRNRKTLLGASLYCHVSKRTAERWHNEFIRLVAVYMGLLEQKSKEQRKSWR